MEKVKTQRDPWRVHTQESKHKGTKPFPCKKEFSTSQGRSAGSKFSCCERNTPTFPENIGEKEAENRGYSISEWRCYSPDARTWSAYNPWILSSAVLEQDELSFRLSFEGNTSEFTIDSFMQIGGNQWENLISECSPNNIGHSLKKHNLFKYKNMSIFNTILNVLSFFKMFFLHRF